MHSVLLLQDYAYIYNEYIYSKERTIRREREIPFTSSISAMDSIVPFLSNDKVSVLSRPDSWNLGLRTMVT